LWLFGGLAEDIGSGDPLVRFDLTVASTLHDAATPALTTFFLLATALGSVETIALLGLAGAVVFGLRRQRLRLATCSSR
jgi:hypothetical protein